MGVKRSQQIEWIFISLKKLDFQKISFRWEWVVPTIYGLLCPWMFDPLFYSIFSLISFFWFLLDEIEAKIDILKEMKPKNINDFIPLMSVTTTKLNQYKWNVKYNSNNMVGENHIIYYFSEKLNVSYQIECDIVWNSIYNWMNIQFSVRCQLM